MCDSTPAGLFLWFPVREHTRVAPILFLPSPPRCLRGPATPAVQPAQQPKHLGLAWIPQQQAESGAQSIPRSGGMNHRLGKSRTLLTTGCVDIKPTHTALKAKEAAAGSTAVYALSQPQAITGCHPVPDTSCPRRGVSPELLEQSHL